MILLFVMSITLQLKLPLARSTQTGSAVTRTWAAFFDFWRMKVNFADPDDETHLRGPAFAAFFGSYEGPDRLRHPFGGHDTVHAFRVREGNIGGGIHQAADVSIVE